jgi:ribosomal protein S18 acetylase RimI-like enzyme
MGFDPAISLRLINNERLRRSQGWGTYRDLGGALAFTSDAPTPDSNRIEGFTADDARVEGLLDIGFALLRAFDCEPAACITPLDRPASLPDRLAQRGLQPSERTVTLVLGAGAPLGSANPEVEVRRATPDDAPAFAAVVSVGGPRWARTLILSSTLEAVLEASNTHYLGLVEGQAVGTLQLLIDGATGGFYAAATLKAHRERGVCSALLATAVADARAAGCDVIGLRTAAEGPARHLFESRGFTLAHESVLWTAPGRD